ncbi:MAG: protein kinase, partial [Planctomycetes bacterium]|nr:protein kinase [Planctomycetota bacterium]
MAPPGNLDLARVRRLFDGAFEVFEVLGAGASGAVFRARTRSDAHGVAAGSDVALKVLRPERAADETARATLVREAELGRRVRDKHVVAILGAGEVQDERGPLLYLVSELVRGRSLRGRIEAHGAVVGDLARRIAEHSCLGLAALHEAGIVHRDVKPENLLITDADVEVRLTDLGLARADDGPSPLGSSSGFHGSLAYAAPELLTGGAASPASDVYALGVVLFELLTSRHPFAEARDADSLIHAHLHASPPRASHLEPRVSAFLDTIVQELLAKDPGARPQPTRALARIFAEGEASTFWRERERRAPALASRRRLLALQRTRHTEFVGRTDEAKQLDHEFEQAIAGVGRSVVVHGHAGSGRRRLLDERIESWLLAREDLVFLGGIADSDPTSRLGTPFPRMLCEVLLEGEREDAPHARERLAERAQDQLGFDAIDAALLAELCAGDVRSATTDRAARAGLLARALARLASRGNPMVVRVDRADDLDSTAQRVVELLMQRALAMPLLLLLVRTRPWDGDAAPDLELEIGPLPQADFVALGRALFRPGEGDEALLIASHATLNGQPRALIESLEELVADGRLSGTPGDFFALAPTVHELHPARPALQRLRTRIAALPQEQRHVLQAAAVLGDRFELADVQSLTGRPALEVLDSLAAFDNRVAGIEGGEGQFRHRAYRLATLATIPAATLRSLHREAAWVRDARGAGSLEVGMHLSRAMEHAACLEPLLAGLASLVRANVRHGAVRLVERLRLHLNRLPRSAEHKDQRLRWLLLAGRAWLLLDDEDRSARAFRKAILIARHLVRPREHAEALAGLAELAQLHSRWFAAIQLLTATDALLVELDDDAARVVRTRALMIHARVLAYLGDSLQALKLASQALRTLPAGHDALEAHLRIDYARWLALRLHLVKALGELDAAAELAHRCGDT